MGNIVSDVLCMPMWTATTVCACALGCVEHICIPLAESIALAVFCVLYGLALALAAACQWPIRILQDLWYERTPRIGARYPSYPRSDRSSDQVSLFSRRVFV
ncbi:hypothetical protein C8Q80DRAFT_1205481 [Daedaleopsis nitida]|nr:hypothetical protein C8Q80DRAFT_1205481 [Daedaleopsis nitida]